MCDGQGLICMCAAPRPPPALLYPRRQGQFAASSAPSALPGSLELRGSRKAARFCNYSYFRSYCRRSRLDVSEHYPAQSQALRAAIRVLAARPGDTGLGPRYSRVATPGPRVRSRRTVGVTSTPRPLGAKNVARTRGDRSGRTSVYRVCDRLGSRARPRRSAGVLVLR